MQQVSVCFGIRLVCFETRPISCRDRDFSQHFQTKKKMIFYFCRVCVNLWLGFVLLIAKL